MQIRQLASSIIAACGVGLALLFAGGLYVADMYRGHTASVEHLDNLQFAVARLGLHIGELHETDDKPLDLTEIRRNLDTVRDALKAIDHPEAATARAHADEIDAVLATIDSHAVQADLDAAGRRELSNQVAQLRAAEARLSLSESAILQDRHRQLDQHLITAVGAMGVLALIYGLLCIGGFRLLYRRVHGPVQALTDAARLAGDGNLRQRLPVTSHDEFAVLTRAFNSMMDRLQQRDADVRDYQSRLARTLSERSTVLNALPAHIAVLDIEGVIRDVNEPWRDFGRANSYSDPGFGLGSNYLTICEQPAEEQEAEGSEAAAGIHAVLAGDRTDFTLEYPCHSPDQKRWFRMMVRRVELPPDAEVKSGRAGAVVMHIDITQRRIAEDELREQTHLLQVAGRMARFGGWSADLANDEATLSDESAEILEVPPGRPIELTKALTEFYVGGSRERLWARWEECVAEGTPWSEELELITGSGSRMWVRLTGEAVRDAAGNVTQIRGSVQEITSYKRIEQQLRRLAYEDALTGLPSSHGFRTRLAEMLVEPQTRPHGYVAVVDLKGLNDINQAFGYEFGNELLIAVARRLEAATAQPDLVGRIGGDQFAVLHIGRPPDAPTAPDAAAWLEDLFHEPLVIDSIPIRVRMTSGIAALESDGADADELMRRAMLAFHVAREGDGPDWALYNRHLDEAALDRIRVSQDLNHALDREELELHYQPKVGLHDGKVISAEALLRWRHPTRGLVPPDWFIPMAEHSKAILPIGEWVLRQACECLHEWQRDNLAAARIAVNVSMVQLTESDLVSTVARIIRETGVEASGLSLEITESALDQDSTAVQAQLARLHELGVGLSLDDFGTGYSSLSHLHRYQFDEIKIDRTFVAQCLSQRYSRDIIRMVVSVATALDCRVVAEGIETPEQGELLRELGCDIGQGYYYSLPLQAEDFRWLLKHRLSLPLSESGHTADIL